MPKKLHLAIPVCGSSFLIKLEYNLQKVKYIQIFNAMKNPDPPLVKLNREDNLPI